MFPLFSSLLLHSSFLFIDGMLRQVELDGMGLDRRGDDRARLIM